MRRSAALLLLSTSSLTALALACSEPAAPPDDAYLTASRQLAARGEGGEASARAHLDLREERAALAAAAEALSDAIQAQGIVAALGAAFAEDVQFLSPRMPILQGASAATSFLATNPIAPTAMRWDVVKVDVSSDGTQGYTWAQGFATINLGTGATELPTLFLIYWRRGASDAGGAWQVAAMSFNLRDPEASTTLPAAFGTPTSKHRRYFPNTDVADERAALLAADAAFSALSVSQGTGVAFQTFAAPTGIAVGGGAFVLGPEAIGEAFAPSSPADLVSWVPVYSDVAASGDLGFTVGNATFDLAVPDVTFYTKYLTVWQKQNDGDWRFVADLGSSRPGT